MSDFECEYEDDGYDYAYDSDGGGGAMDTEDGQQGGEAAAVDPAIEMENAFYEGDDVRGDDPSRAMELFRRVVALEEQHAPASVQWRFKALQQMTILSCGALPDPGAALGTYEAMLALLPRVSRNEGTDAIHAALEAAGGSGDAALLAKVYEVTLRALRDANNDRLWFQTNIRLARLYLEAGRHAEVNRMVAELKQSCMRADGSVDASRATALIEAYCLEIQLCTATHDHARMRDVYPKTLHLNAAVSDPRIMGVIREEGGKMYLSEGAWMTAYNEFFEAFRAFQEAGSPRAKACLKYVVLASMLALSDINPFAAREARIYAEDAEVAALGELRRSLEVADLPRFERVLRDPRNRVAEEPLLLRYLEPLRKKMREQVLLNVTKPYRRVSLAFLAEELMLGPSSTTSSPSSSQSSSSQSSSLQSPYGEAEALVVEMVLDGRLPHARIDQLRGHVDLMPQHQQQKQQALGGNRGNINGAAQGGRGAGAAQTQYLLELTTMVDAMSEELCNVHI